eukprot:7961232-Lingulodinium_polyedra.AAC.1
MVQVLRQHIQEIKRTRKGVWEADLGRRGETCQVVTGPNVINTAALQQRSEGCLLAGDRVV